MNPPFTHVGGGDFFYLLIKIFYDKYGIHFEAKGRRKSMQENAAEERVPKVKHFIETTVTKPREQIGKRISKILEEAGLGIAGITATITLKIQITGDAENDRILGAVREIRKTFPQHGVKAHSEAPRVLPGRRISTDQRCDD